MAFPRFPQQNNSSQPIQDSLGNPVDAVAQKLVLQSHLCPGDDVIMTAALAMLHQQYPQKFLTKVQNPSPAIWSNNPYISDFEGGTEIEMHYPLIHHSNSRPVHFLQGYVEWLAEKLYLPLKLTTNRPHLYLTDAEKEEPTVLETLTGFKKPYWLICSGFKDDFTVKAWGRYQEVVDHFQGRIQFVQVGEVSPGHHHKRLRGVISMVGLTELRELIRLAYKASGGLGGVSLLHHIFAAFEKPFVCVASGMESKSWEQYSTEVYLTRQGTLSCCATGGCWKNRTVALNDGEPSDKNICEKPVNGFPKCMDMIKPAEVIAAIESFYEGGRL